MLTVSVFEDLIASIQETPQQSMLSLEVSNMPQALGDTSAGDVILGSCAQASVQHTAGKLQVRRAG